MTTYKPGTSGPYEVENKHTGEMITIEFRGTLEVDVDMEPFGSTYVPRETASMSEVQWLLNGQECALWRVQHELAMVGYTAQESLDVLRRIEESWKEE